MVIAAPQGTRCFEDVFLACEVRQRETTASHSYLVIPPMSQKTASGHKRRELLHTRRQTN